MNSTAAFLAIVGAISLGAVSPGPSFLFIAHLAANRRSFALQATLGMALGGALYGLLAIWGIAKVISTTPLAMNLLRVIGGMFLLYLCFTLLRNARQGLMATSDLTARFGPFARGLITQISNPKTMIIYVSVYGALLPQEPANWLYVALPVAMFTIEAVWYSCVSFTLSTASSRDLYLRGKRWIDSASGCILGLIGLSFIAGIWVK